MEFRDGLIQGFELKFRSVAEDTERYLFALVDLLEEGTIEEVPGQSLYSSHYSEGYTWILDSYVEKGLSRKLEDYFTPSGDVSFAPFPETMLRYLDLLLEMGESARVRRIWRAQVGLMKPHYWLFIQERDKCASSTEPQQRQHHQELAARIPELKETLLGVMADYRALLADTGATHAEFAWVDADIAAIEAEERRRPTGKTDNRSMTEDVFWELIDHGLGDQPMGERLDSLPDRLALFKPAAIRKFDRILREQDAAAYRTDIWALAYLLQGGCSDDSFDAFRGWLILQGRAVFEATLASPDDFDVTLHHGESGGMDALRAVAPMAFDLREGKVMKPVKGPPLELTGPEIEEEESREHLPNVAAGVGRGRTGG
jgi:hypothetical protein